MVKFKKKKISIDWHGEKREVDAYVAGNLAVHKTISDDTKFLWVISHVGTGLSVGYNYPPFRIMKEAKEVVSDLLEKDDWSWEYAKTQTLFNIMTEVFEKHTGIFWEKHGVTHEEAIAKIPLPHSKCVKCGERSQRLILSEFKGIWGWMTWCFKCMPHLKGIEKEKGKVCRW